MTYENCLKYFEEAEDKETKEFWRDRIARKYPDKAIEEKPKEEVEIKPKKKEKK